MRLFGKLTGTVDRYDRAEWLTPIFDRAFDAPAPIPTVAATVYGPYPNAFVYSPYPHGTVGGT